MKNLSFYWLNCATGLKQQIRFEIRPFNHLSRYLWEQDRCFVTENREENLSKLPWLSDRIWARKIDDKQIELTELKTVGEEALSSNLRILEFIVWVYGLANPKFTRSHKEFEMSVQRKSASVFSEVGGLFFFCFKTFPPMSLNLCKSRISW